jgi:hypothetical protein
VVEQDELLLQCIRALRQAVPDTPIVVKVPLFHTIHDASTTSSSSINSSVRSSISSSTLLYLKLIEEGVLCPWEESISKGFSNGSCRLQQVVQVCGQ